MIYRTLIKKTLPRFLDTVSKNYRLIVPEQKGRETYTFRPYSGFSNVATEFLRTVIPPKQFFLPPKEGLFHISGTSDIKVGTEEEPFSIIFGLHSCDLHGIDILDKAFSYGGRDSFYWRRREKTGFIGLSCLPDKYCLCKSMHTDFIVDIYDLFLYTLDEVYLVSVRTALGDDMLRLCPDLFREPTEKEIAEYKDRIEERESMFTRIMDITNLADLLTLEYKSDVWEQYSHRCLFCGSCVMVCPTCQCFDIYDSTDLLTDITVRWRRWDACMRKDYALVTGGHNFRGARPERFRFRYLHKEIGFAEMHGKATCTGCGRCSETCPAGIDMVEVVRSIRE